jgi:hypothetical protein
VKLALPSREQDLLQRVKQPPRALETALYVTRAQTSGISVQSAAHGAKVWVGWLQTHGVPASSADAKVPWRFRPSGEPKEGVAVQVPTAWERRAFDLLYEQAPGLLLPRPDGVVLPECLITDETVAVAGKETVCVLQHAQLRGVEQQDSDGGSATYLLYRDWRDSPGRARLGSKEAVAYPAALSIAEPELIREIYADLCAGCSTAELAKSLKKRRALGTRSWTRAYVRTLITSDEFNRGRSPLGAVDAGTWEAAQQTLEREIRERGRIRERVLPRTRHTAAMTLAT